MPTQQGKPQQSGRRTAVPRPAKHSSRFARTGSFDMLAETCRTPFEPTDSGCGAGQNKLGRKTLLSSRATLEQTDHGRGQGDYQENVYKSAQSVGTDNAGEPEN